DPGSPRADYFVPYFLAAVQAAPVGRAPSNAREAARLLAQWDRRYTRVNTRAVLFEAAMRELARHVWGALPRVRPGLRRVVPSSAVLAALLRDSSSAWWSQWGAPRSASRSSGVAAVHPRGGNIVRDSLLAVSLTAAYDSVRSRYGPPDSGGWRWDRIQHANIY